MTVEEALRLAATRFSAAGCQTPRLDAELLLAEVLHVGREALYREPERRLRAVEARRFSDFVARRELREPVAYIIGRRAFRTVQLAVGPGVLVPRPETETLVEVALDELARLDRSLDSELGLVDTAGPADSGAAPQTAGEQSASKRRDATGALQPQTVSPVLRLLDVGTGSGCIALALATEHPGVHVVATDVDQRALRYARLNARRLGVQARVEFVCGDLFDGLAAGQLFEVIVSNPPYLSEEDLAGVQREVRVYEPRHALVGGVTGMEPYARLVPAARRFLVPGGLLAVEIHELRAAEVVDCFTAGGRFEQVCVHHDLGGAPRVVSGRAPG